MIATRTIHGLALFAIALGTTQVHAAEPTTAGTFHDGRYYEVVIANGITWDNAKVAAQGRTYNGLQGHLVTIGSRAEDEAVDALSESVGGGEFWAGGYQVACTTTVPKPEPACGWLWINGESISASNIDSPYTNWLHKQPDNQGGDEQHLAIGQSQNKVGWNDEGDESNIIGYIIEYGDEVTIKAAECAAIKPNEYGPGCNPTGVQLLRYPPTAKLANNATLTARTFAFADSPERCGNETLVLFGGDVVIPRYLCGHPNFVVIETKAVGVEVPFGAILTEASGLPGNQYSCAGDDDDPSHRDVVGWQHHDPAFMVESSQGAPGSRYEGTVAEVTYECGSTRGKDLNASYRFVGLQIHPGVLDTVQSFVGLIQYKLKLLVASVDTSKDTLPGNSYVALRAHAKNALQYHDRGSYAAALDSIGKFRKEMAASKYRPVEGRNPSGEHDFRSANIEFMYTQKLLPYVQ